MSQFNKNDAASNSVFWAAQQLKVQANTANRDALYGNTTADAFVPGTTIGLFAVDAAETSAKLGAVAHSGWVLRTVGSGGRSGRVHYETLVAGGLATDGSDDAVMQDIAIVITSQPPNRTANATSDQIATFPVTAITAPTGGSLTYFWQIWGGASFANVAANVTFSNVTTATLAVNANTAVNGQIYRVGIETAGATTIYSSNAVLTRTT